MSLQDMLHHKLVAPNDTVQFVFKGHCFRAKILRGGLIGECSCNNIPILMTVTAFSSLTAWTEACLQDHLEEYYTRYSSWKRVLHKESKRSMGDLRDQCKLLSKKRKRDEEIPELYKEIYRLQQTIVEMKQHIEKWEKGDAPTSKDWKVVSIKPVVKPRNVTDRVQYIALGEPRGIDMELYNILT